MCPNLQLVCTKRRCMCRHGYRKGQPLCLESMRRDYPSWASKHKFTQGKNNFSVSEEWEMTFFRRRSSSPAGLVSAGVVCASAFATSEDAYSSRAIQRLSVAIQCIRKRKGKMEAKKDVGEGPEERTESLPANTSEPIE